MRLTVDKEMFCFVASILQRLYYYLQAVMNTGRVNAVLAEHNINMSSTAVSARIWKSLG